MMNSVLGEMEHRKISRRYEAVGGIHGSYPKFVFERQEVHRKIVIG